MNVLTLVNKINQKVKEYEELKPRDPMAIRFRFFRQESRSVIVMDSGFKCQAIEDHYLELQNNKKSMLIDTNYIMSIEFFSSLYIKDQDL